MKKSILMLLLVGSGVIVAQTKTVVTSNGEKVTFNPNNWGLTGNANTSAVTNFMGTIDDNDVVFKRNNVRSGLLNSVLSNTSWGVDALSNTTGSFNTASGMNALKGNTTGGYNTANGVNALRSNTAGVYNTANGVDALYNSTVANNNVANGYRALYSTVGGYDNVAVGTYALTTNTSNNNTALGTSALRFNTSGSDNVATGQNTLRNNTSGNFNSASGKEALFSNTTGQQNTAFGARALHDNTTATSNTAIGYNALTVNTGKQNTAVGSSSLVYNTTGELNVATGNIALEHNTTGTQNTGIGFAAFNTNSIGSRNTAVGHFSGEGIMTGSANTIIGANITGLPAALSNNIIIADGDGNQRINVIEDGKVGIGTNAPGAKLEINNGTTVGAIKIVDGTQGSNKVLTSDANGMGSWQAISGSWAGYVWNANKLATGSPDIVRFDNAKTIINGVGGSVDGANGKIIVQKDSIYRIIIYFDFNQGTPSGNACGDIVLNTYAANGTSLSLYNCDNVGARDGVRKNGYMQAIGNITAGGYVIVRSTAEVTEGVMSVELIK